MREEFPLLYRLCAESATSCTKWDISQALRAGLRGGRSGSTKAEKEGVDGKDDKEIDDTRDDEEGDEGIEEAAVLEDTAVEGEDEGGKIWLAADGGDEGIDKVRDEGVDDGGKGGADDDGDGKVDHVTAQDKVAKAFEHGISGKVRCWDSGSIREGLWRNGFGCWVGLMTLLGDGRG